VYIDKQEVYIDKQEVYIDKQEVYIDKQEVYIDITTKLKALSQVHVTYNSISVEDKNKQMCQELIKTLRYINTKYCCLSVKLNYIQQ